MSDEDVEKLVRGPYEDIVKAAQAPQMAQRLEAAAARIGHSISVKVGLAIEEAESTGNAEHKEQQDALVRLERCVEDLKNIREQLELRPLCDRFAKHLELAYAVGADASRVKELRTEAVRMVKQYKKVLEDAKVQKRDMTASEVRDPTQTYDALG